MHKNTDFPQYRKLSNGKAYYKILDERNFVEIQLMGSKKITHTIKAVQYPEILRIKEMLDVLEPFEIAFEGEFNEMLNEFEK